MNRDDQLSAGGSRRSFVRKALYVTPAVLTLKANPAFATYGSGGPQQNTDSYRDGLKSLFSAWLE
jgi:hypothetical protein